MRYPGEPILTRKITRLSEPCVICGRPQDVRCSATCDCDGCQQVCDDVRTALRDARALSEAFDGEIAGER